jgi:hypothetical protein
MNMSSSILSTLYGINPEETGLDFSSEFARLTANIDVFLNESDQQLKLHDYLARKLSHKRQR